jgi:hypothetical protein
VTKDHLVDDRTDPQPAASQPSQDPVPGLAEDAARLRPPASESQPAAPPAIQSTAQPPAQPTAQPTIAQPDSVLDLPAEIHPHTIQQETPQAIARQAADDTQFAASPLRTPVRIQPADPWAHRRAEPRPLALMWTAYLLIATIACLGPVTAAHYLTPDVYRPAAALLMAAALLGVTVYWPMIRLSQQLPGHRPSRSIFLDSIAIFFPLQATIWPQAMPALSSWNATITAAVALHATAWLAIIGSMLCLALVHIARGEAAGFSTQLRRTGWMGACVLVTFAASGYAFINGAFEHLGTPTSAPPTYIWSPASVVFDITADRSWLGVAAQVQPIHWWSGMVLLLAGVCMWILTIVIEAFALRELSGRPSNPTQTLSE